MDKLNKRILQRAYQAAEHLCFNEATLIDLVRQVCLDVRCNQELNEDLSAQAQQDYAEANGFRQMDEWELKEEKMMQEWLLKKQNCEHEWYYKGTYHGEDSYNCGKCGEFKWV